MIRNSFTRVQSFVRPLLEKLPGYATCGAWFFALGSMLPLLWLLSEGHGADGTARVFGTTVEGQEYSIWGLSYAGSLGAVVLWMELLAVAIAAAATGLPDRMMQSVRIRRLRRSGHAFLIGWSALWMFGTMHLASVDPGFWTGQAAFLTTLFACTVYRAVKRWSPAEPGQIASDAMPRSESSAESPRLLHRSAVRPSSRLEEIDPFEASRWRSKIPPLRLAIDDQPSETAPTACRTDRDHQLLAGLRSFPSAAADRARSAWSFCRAQSKRLGALARSAFADITRTAQTRETAHHQGR